MKYIDGEEHYESPYKQQRIIKSYSFKKTVILKVKDSSSMTDEEKSDESYAGRVLQSLKAQEEESPNILQNASCESHIKIDRISDTL